jgi:hypothetical protein
VLGRKRGTVQLFGARCVMLAEKFILILEALLRAANIPMEL